MNLQQIHDMAADALAGEELQFRNNGDWIPVPADHLNLFHPNFHWRIKPTIEVNGVMMSKRQAKAAWEASGATSYEYYNSTNWSSQPDMVPTWSSQQYRWQEPKWVYVNGEKIVRSGGTIMFAGCNLATALDVQTLMAAIKKLVEIK